MIPVRFGCDCFQFHQAKNEDMIKVLRAGDAFASSASMIFRAGVFASD